MKLRLILPFFLFLPFIAFAQHGPVKIGMKVMPESTRIMEIYKEGKSRFAFSGGVQLLYPFSSKLSMESGLYYLDTGGATEIPTNIGNRTSVRVSYHFYSLSVPLQLRYRAAKLFYVSAGPSLEYDVRSKSMDEDGRTLVVDLNNKPLNLGAGLALGYEAPMLALNKLDFFLEARLNTIFEESFQLRTLNYGAGIGFHYAIR